MGFNFDSNYRINDKAIALDCLKKWSERVGVFTVSEYKKDNRFNIKTSKYSLVIMEINLKHQHSEKVNQRSWTLKAKLTDQQGKQFKLVAKIYKESLNGKEVWLKRSENFIIKPYYKNSR